jgi:hypothetical protein
MAAADISDAKTPKGVRPMAESRQFATGGASRFFAKTKKARAFILRGSNWTNGVWRFCPLEQA